MFPSYKAKNKREREREYVLDMAHCLTYLDISTFKLIVEAEILGS